ncbi:MAG: hypothetical protein ACE5SW_08320 [Nitrososphaeraceae archaeon]
MTVLLTLCSFSVKSEIPYISGQIHTPDTQEDATQIAVVLYINEDRDGNSFFNPSEFTIKEGEEVLILNNSTQNHSFTNGKSIDDQMAGTKFDTGLIKPGSFAEYLALNVSPGEYPFYSSADPENMKGTMIISSSP